MLKEKIKKNYKVYSIYKILRGNDSVFNERLRAITDNECPVLVINGENYESNIYYVITIGNHSVNSSGCFALVDHTIRMLKFAESVSLKICVHWGKQTLYYDEKMGENVFEYYYRPIDISHEDLIKMQCRTIMSNNKDKEYSFEKFFNRHYAYKYMEEDVVRFAVLYKKYFVLNSKTAQYINDEIKKIFDSDCKVLGVHVRGTDYKKQYDSHPQFQGFGPYLNATKKVFYEGDFDKIFIATDDLEALEMFRKEFGANLLFYEDCERTTGNIGVHVKREKSPYLLGLDVLRDVYTLAACDGLVCGLSQVSFAAQYVKKAKAEEYEVIEKIDMKINHNSFNAQEDLLAYDNGAR